MVAFPLPKGAVSGVGLGSEPYPTRRAITRAGDESSMMEG